MRTAILFYSGTLISSIGSFTYNICLVAFMAKAGFDLFHVSLILGLQRLVPILITGVLGQYTDRISPRRTVIAAELGAATASFGTLWAWKQGTDAYPFLLAFTLLKSSFAAFQLGSRAKLTKLLAGPSYQSNSRHAIWFNKTTQGATLFAGLAAWPIISYLNFTTAIWIDMITFVINGALVWISSFHEEQAGEGGQTGSSVFAKFTDLYRYSGRAARFDLLLAVCMMGTTSLTSRFAGNDKVWVAALIGGYGLSVWISGFIEASRRYRLAPELLWLVLGVSYGCLGFFAGSGLTTLALALLKDTAYWLLYHRISAHIQTDTPQSLLGAVTSARMTQMIVVLATGELLVGAWSNSLSIVYDGAWRAALSLMIGASVVFSTARAPAAVRTDYAKL